MIFCVQNESSSLSLSPMTQIVNTSSEDAADKSAARNDSNDTSASSVTTTIITNSPAQNETLIKLPDPPPPPTPLPPTSNSPPTAKEPPPPPILEPICSDSSPNVDDGLTSLSWLQNLNMCMTRLGATTPLTPPASPASQVCSSLGSFHHHHHHHRYHQNYHPHVHGSVRSGSMKGLPISCKHSNHHHPHHLSSSSPSSSGNGSSSSSTSSSNTTGRSERSSRSAGHSSSSSSSTSTKNKRTLPRPEEMIDYKINGTDKPPYSYATLICMAMKANQNKMTLAAIYRWIKENFLYYKNAEPSWQNSIRHNLSLNKCFLKVPRTKEEPGKGGFWRLDPEYAETLVDGVFKKRRPSQRNNPTNGTILKRKSRKKDIQSDEVSIDEKAQSSSQNDVIKTIITVHPMKSYEPLLIHDTPPSSAESCTFIENGGETAELVSAVNSIDNLSTSQCNEGPFSQYTIHIGDHSSYGEETGITLNGIGDASMVSTEVPNDDNHHHLFSQENGGDICWNAILTDADLELLSSTSFPGRIVHTTVNGSDLDTSVSSNQLTPLSNPTDSSSDGSGINNTGSTLHLVDPPTVHVMDATSSSLPSAASLFRQAVDVVGSNSGANTNRNSSASVIGGTVCSSSGGGGNGSSLNRLLASNHTTATTSTSIAASSVTSTTVSSILNGRIPILTSGNNGICDIISANHNVVTCVNPDPSNVNNSTDWWTPFASLQHSLSDQSLASPDMISIQAIDGNHSDLMSSPIILAPVSSTSNANVNDDGRNNNSHNYVVDRSTSSLASCQTSFSSHHSNSIPNHGNRGQHDCIQIADGLMDSKIESDSNPFDPQSNLQPWIECKAALEAAAFDLEQFSVLENCSDF